MSLCRDCFHSGNHIAEGHDYNMFKSQAGGACDCGDASVMRTSGFCSKVKKGTVLVISSDFIQIRPCPTHSGTLLNVIWLIMFKDIDVYLAWKVVARTSQVTFTEKPYFKITNFKKKKMKFSTFFDQTKSF